MPDIKRLNYFNSQFLVEKDFQEEQAYHLGQRRQHNLKLHGWGIVEGLEVSYPGTGTALNVGPGMAIDAQGRELVLAVAAKIDPGKLALNTTGWITIAYQENAQSGDPIKLGPDTRYTRTTEGATLAWSATQPAADGSVLLLARVVFVSTSRAPAGDYLVDGGSFRTLAGHGVQTSSSLTVRNIRVTGIIDSPEPDQGTSKHAPLRVSGRLVIDPNDALTGADGSGALSIHSKQGTAGYHFRTTQDPGGAPALRITMGEAPSDGADLLTLYAGNIGINSPNPDYVIGPGYQIKPTLRINAAIVAENSDLYFTNTTHEHTGYGNQPGSAAIENDSGTHKALMILGRNIGPDTGGQGLHRVVKLWDELYVNGLLTVVAGRSPAKLRVEGDIEYTGKLTYVGRPQY